jgi:serine/threonine protein kinase
MTGSIRYLAPEVADSKPYNHTCDVYSFAILLWQLLALKTPFDNCATKQTIQHHVCSGKRPPVLNDWNKDIQLCLKQCWSKNLDERPDMKQVVEILRKEIAFVAHVHKGVASGVAHTRRSLSFHFRVANEAC